MQYAKYLTLFLPHVKSSPSKKLKKIERSQRDAFQLLALHTPRKFF